MYFEKSGLERIRSQLELSLRRNPNTLIKIFCCGYAMPGWESTMVETVLDMPVHYYEWRRQNRGRGSGGSRSGGLGGGLAKNDADSAAAAAAGADAAAQDVPLAADSFIDQYNLSSTLPNLSRNSNTNSTNHGRSRGGGRGGGMAAWYEQNDNNGTGVMDPFLRKKNSTFRPDPLPGYHPDDLIYYGWDDFCDNKKTNGKNNDDDDKDTTEKKFN
jgi:hypothetical protein